MPTAIRALAVFAVAAGALLPEGEAGAAGKDASALVEKKLPNGLRVVIQEDHRMPTVAMEIAYAAGTSSDPVGRSGLATVVDWAMTHRTKHVPAGGVSRTLVRAGATTWANFVWIEKIRSTVTLPASRFEVPLWLWSDQMGFFDESFDEPMLEEERTGVLASDAKTHSSASLGQVSDFMNAALYPSGHPYRAPATSVDGLRAITRADVIQFHDRWIVPENATLTLVGDVNPTEALASIEKYFGPIPRGNGAAAVDPAPVVLEGETTLSIDAHVSAPEVWIRWPTPPLYAEGDADLDVVSHLLDGTSVAYLYWKLVDELKVATHVHANQWSRLHGSLYEVRVTGAAGGDAKSLLAAVNVAMKRLYDEPTSLVHFTSASREYLIPKVFGVERFTNRAAAYTAYATNTGSADFFSADMLRYDAVSAASVSAAARRYLPRARRVVALVSPSPNAPVTGTLVATTFTPAVAP
jgi:zinc protease